MLMMLPFVFLKYGNASLQAAKMLTQVQVQERAPKSCTLKSSIGL